MSPPTKKVSPAEHAAWLERVLARTPTARCWWMEREGEPVGTVRFDRERDEATISVTVAADIAGAKSG